jgi:hypothetical protein
MDPPLTCVYQQNNVFNSPSFSVAILVILLRHPQPVPMLLAQGRIRHQTNVAYFALYIPVQRCWHVNGLPDGVMLTCTNFKKMMMAQEGPWKSKVASVTFAADKADAKATSLENATEHATETVRTDGVEAYCSPFISHHLKNKESCPFIGAIDFDPDLCASFLGPEGTMIDIPQDGPPLPEDFVGSIVTDPTTSYKTAYFHVDTGATCIVTDQQAELHCPVPTQATCGTAAKGPRTLINAMGCLVLNFVSNNGHVIPLEFLQATEIQQVQQRSLSCHALKDLGYEVQHAFLTTGNLLRLRKVGTTTWHSIPLVTHRWSDYVKVQLHLPAIEGVTKFTSNTALTTQTMARIDLLNKFQSLTGANAIIMLVHLRYGCARGVILQGILNSLSIKTKVLKDFQCPICMAEGTAVTLSRGSISPLLFLPLGARVQMDFWFLQSAIDSWFHLFSGDCRITQLTSMGVSSLLQTSTC